MSRLRSLATSLGDRLNPVLVKELRQATQAKFTAITLVLLLGVLLLSLGLILITADLGSSGSDDTGAVAFIWLLKIIQIAAGLALPGFLAGRIMAERSSNELEMVFASGLSAGAVVRGKLLSGMILAGLLYSIGIPFMAFTFLLRGIDLPMILICSTISILLAAPALQLAILVAFLPVRRAVNILLLILCGFFALIAIILLDELLPLRQFSYRTTGIFYGQEFWTGSVVLGCLAVAVTVLLAILATAAVAPVTSNRMLPFRVAATVVWLVVGLGALVADTGGGRAAVESWFFVSVVMLCMALLGAVSERDAQGARVRRQIPRGMLGRWLVFPFFTGSANGIVWAVSMLLLTAAVVVFGNLSGVSDQFSVRETLTSGAAMAVQGLGYALAAFAIQRRFLAERLRRGATWLLAVVLAVLGMVVSVTVEILLFAGIRPTTDLGFWHVFNPFALGDRVVSATVAYLGPMALVVLLAFTWRRLWRQVVGFKPPPAADAS